MACLTVLGGKVSTRLLLLFLKRFAKWHLRYATVAPGCHSDWWPACHSREQKFSKNLHFLDILESEGSGKFLGAKVQQKIAPLSPLPCLEVAFSCEPFHKLWLSHISIVPLWGEGYTLYQSTNKFVLFQSLMLLNSLHSATHTRPFLGICRISWTRYRAQPSPRQDSCVSQVAVGPRWGICEISWTNQSATPESSCHTSHSVSHLHFTTVDKYTWHTWHYTFTLHNFIVLLFTINKVRTCNMRNIPRGQTEKLISRGEVRSYLAHHHQ